MTALRLALALLLSAPASAEMIRINLRGAPRAAAPALGPARGLPASLLPRATIPSAPPRASIPLPHTVAIPGVAVPALTAPTHWSPERVPDPRYSAILERAAAKLFPDPAADSLRPRILQAMAGADPAVYSHMMRVGLIAGAVALELGLPLENAREIAWGARLHDIGKLDPAVSAVINKRGALTEDERKTMMRHTELGVDILFDQDDVPAHLRWIAMKVALNHHEAMDGTGYPQGLSGEKIPREARVTSVADYLDALIENRPYRDGLAVEQALSIMDKNAGKFDPAALAALRRVLAE
jgi:putative nucleotidyltransferase with HDIG domain